MSQEPVFETIARSAVVPVVALDSPEAALPLVDTLLEGGLPLVEFTFRAAAAAEVIGTIARERPEVLVGAGTILTRENLEAARDSGARFGVSPGLNPATVQRAGEIGLPFVPGVATASDIERGLSLGCTVLKFFPSEALGGIAMLKALAAPFRHTGVRFMPTGGVNAANLESYLRLDLVVAVGGTWVAPKEDIEARRWQAIRDRCRAIGELVARLRG